MGLSNKKCTPCNKGGASLSENELISFCDEVPNWTISDKKDSINRDFKFRNFEDALDFLNKVGKIAEQENHHPDVKIGWGYCNVTLQTHSIGGLHENDFIVAAKINEIE